MEDPNEDMMSEINELFEERREGDMVFVTQMVTEVHEIAKRYGVEILKDGGPHWSSTWCLLNCYMENAMSMLMFDASVEVGEATSDPIDRSDILVPRRKKKKP